MGELHQELINKLNDIGALGTRIIFKNENKGRVTLEIKISDKSYILKWNDIENEVHLKRLQKELAFYSLRQENNNKCIPNVYEIGQNYIIMDLINGSTLLEVLKNGCYKNKENSSVMVKEFTKSIKKIYTEYLTDDYDIAEKNSTISIYKEARGYLAKILLSGPMNTKNTAIDKLLLNNLFYFKAIAMYFGKIKKILSGIQNEKHIIHGDLHMNNIFLDSADRIYILDWENYRYGSIYLELAYLWSQIQVAIMHDEEKKNLWEGAFKDIVYSFNLNAESFFFIADYMKKIMVLNKRYSK